MLLSLKTEYAVRAVFELARRAGSGPVTASRIGAVQRIPVRFLENILGQLRQAGIVESVRGKEGGYLLGRSPQEISVGDVVRVAQGPLNMVDCVEGDAGRGCALRLGCVLLPIWDKAHRAMMDIYDGTTFEDLVEQEKASSECEAANYAI